MDCRVGFVLHEVMRRRFGWLAWKVGLDSSGWAGSRGFLDYGLVSMCGVVLVPVISLWLFIWETFLWR